ATAAGFTVTWTRDADGSVRSYSLEAPAGATDAARAGIEVTADVVADATVIWPTEEIGVGARWTVTDRVDDAVAPTRVVTYELTRLEGDLATVRSSTTAPETAPVLTAPAPDGGPDVALEVDTYDVTGSGEFTVDLRAALPAEGRTESSTRAVYVDSDSGLRTTHDEDSALEFSPAGGAGDRPCQATAQLGGASRPALVTNAHANDCCSCHCPSCWMNWAWTLMS